jgi:DNA-binding transcriptional ArsR family regulator
LLAKAVGADRKLTHLKGLCRSKTDPGVLLALPNFWAGTNKVITMEMLGRIRRMHLRDKLSLHEIAKRTGLSRNTVRNWLRAPGEVNKPTYSRTAGFGSKLSGHVAELEHHSKPMRLRPKKDRRTARALFAQIKASGYAGGYTRVTDYIRAWRAALAKKSRHSCH